MAVERWLTEGGSFAAHATAALSELRAVELGRTGP
jgi:hypothetical protein